MRNKQQKGEFDRQGVLSWESQQAAGCRVYAPPHDVFIGSTNNITRISYNYKFRFVHKAI
jgi:hypothetical protein